MTVDRIFEVVFHAYPDFDLVMLVYAGRIVDRDAPTGGGRRRWNGSKQPGSPASTCYPPTIRWPSAGERRRP